MQVLERLLLEAPPFAIGGKEAGLDSGAAAAGYTLPKVSLTQCSDYSCRVTIGIARQQVLGSLLGSFSMAL